MKVVIADVLTEGEIDDPADCVVGNRVMVRLTDGADPPNYKTGILVSVEPAAAPSEE